MKESPNGFPLGGFFSAADESTHGYREHQYTNFAFEKRALEGEKDSEIRILENKVELLTNSYETEKENHNATTEQLSAAYGRLEKVSIASVDGAKAQETISKIVAMTNEKSGK